jgi:hypothetical protein
MSEDSRATSARMVLDVWFETQDLYLKHKSPHERARDLEKWLASNGIWLAAMPPPHWAIDWGEEAKPEDRAG